jgi:hypothetical protein
MDRGRTEIATRRCAALAMTSRAACREPGIATRPFRSLAMTSGVACREPGIATRPFGPLAMTAWGLSRPEITTVPTLVTASRPTAGVAVSSLRKARGCARGPEIAAARCAGLAMTSGVACRETEIATRPFGPLAMTAWGLSRPEIATVPTLVTASRPTAGVAVSSLRKARGCARGPEIAATAARASR